MDLCVVGFVQVLGDLQETSTTAHHGGVQGPGGHIYSQPIQIKKIMNYQMIFILHPAPIRCLRN